MTKIIPSTAKKPSDPATIAPTIASGTPKPNTGIATLRKASESDYACLRVWSIAACTR